MRQLAYCPGGCRGLRDSGRCGAGAHLLRLPQLWSVRLAAVLRGLLRVNPAVPATRCAGRRARSLAGGLATWRGGKLPSPLVGSCTKQPVGRAGCVARWLAGGWRSRSEHAARGSLFRSTRTPPVGPAPLVTSHPMARDRHPVRRRAFARERPLVRTSVRTKRCRACRIPARAPVRMYGRECEERPRAVAHVYG